MRLSTSILVLPLMLSGCATANSAWTPQIDMKNINQATYETDFTECRRYAETNPGADKGKNARKGALAMGAVGGVAMIGMTVASGGLALLPAIAAASVPAIGTGVALGAAEGAVVADAKYKGVIGACLQGRGYNVIGDNGHWRFGAHG